MENNIDNKIYIKFLINKIIESKLYNLYNKLNNTKIEFKSNYKKIKNEFNNTYKQLGGQDILITSNLPYVLPFDTIYDRNFMIPNDIIFRFDDPNKIEQQKLIQKFTTLQKIITKSVPEADKKKFNKEIAEINKLTNELSDDLKNNVNKDNKEKYKKINDLLIELNKKICNKLKSKYPDIEQYCDK